jgi:hypothetical protein
MTEAPDDFLHDPGNTVRIERIYAYMSIDEKGRNGICAHILPGLGSTPLVTASRSAARAMIPLAEKVARMSGRTIGLYAFARVEGEELWRSQ